MESDDLIRSLPGMAQIGYQGLLCNIITKRKYADSTYEDFTTLEFNITLTTNQYFNFNSLHVRLPTEIKSKAYEDNDVPTGTITVNNFFAPWLKEIDIKRYGDGLQILPVGNSTEVYRYSDAILKHMPAKALKTFEETHFYSKKRLVQLALMIDACI